MQQLALNTDMYTWCTTMSFTNTHCALHRAEIGIEAVKMQKIFMA